MADAETMAASSSQKSILPFDVFISHRGEHMKNGFAGFLYHVLRHCRITCFLDKYELPKAEDARKQMLEAVRETRFQVPIFTEDYGTSDWCLDELVEMMDCQTKGTSKVFPVFYKLTPEELRKPVGPFASQFNELIQKHEQERGKERIKKWKQAVLDASWLFGFTLETDGDVSSVIRDLVTHIEMEIVKDVIVHPEPELVGLDARVEAVLRGFRLHNQRSVYCVLIFGLAGIGKTTLAREFYRHSRRDFQATSFVDSCGDEKQIQKQLCKDLLRERSVKGNIKLGKVRLMDALKGRKVLIVFDDVKDFRCVEKSIDLRVSLSPGSLVLVTSRDRTVFPHEKDFTFMGVKYELPTMDDSSALQLFCHHAFRQPNAREGFDELAMKVVRACAGLPLCLEVLGRHLSSMTTKGHWQEAVEMLRDCKHKDVTACLRMCYDSLEDYEQQVFLDVACFLIGEFEGRAKRFWAVSAAYWETGLERLKHRCLVKVDGVMRLTMHDLLRDLGRDISRSDKTRVWTNEDLQHLLNYGQGLDQVRGIATSLPCLDASRLSEMSSLRLLFLNGTQLTGAVNGLEGLNVRWLRLWNCPSARDAALVCLPSLAVLQLRLRRDHVQQFLSSAATATAMLNNLGELDISTED